MNKSDPPGSEVVHLSIYKVSRINHDAMLHICKQITEMFKQHGAIQCDVSYQTSNNSEMLTEDRVTSIASIISASKDEEVWVESSHFRDRLHLNEVMTKMGTDERLDPLIKQALDILPSGTGYITGAFDRLNM